VVGVLVLVLVLDCDSLAPVDPLAAVDSPAPAEEDSASLEDAALAPCVELELAPSSPPIVVEVSKEGGRTAPESAAAALEMSPR
jgi:hypothetical protein